MNKYMKIAIELAEDNLITNAGGPFGAVVVKDGEIVGKGSNQVVAGNDPTAHAEVTAIRDACKKLGTYDLEGCEIYTSCYPCPMCMSAIIWANIKTVYYGNTKEDAAAIGFRDDYIYKFMEKLSGVGKLVEEKMTEKRTEISVSSEEEKHTVALIEIDREESISSFKKFAKKLDKKIY